MISIMRNLIMLTLLSGSMVSNVLGQKAALRDMHPELGHTPDLSEKAQRDFARRDALLAKNSLSPSESAELDALFERYGEIFEDVWDIIGGACSWYCGEGPYKVVVSSSLPSQGGNDYRGENIHDLSYRTAWVEGVPGKGLGEFVEYYFRNRAPRITEIRIFNGYLKTDKAWQENGRVKTLKLTINGEDFALLHLADTKTEQIFKVDPLGKRADGKDLILRFTILETYDGSKYDDTCITEIYFDGIDVH